MMPSDAMNFRPFFSTFSSRVIDFSSSCGTSAVWQCRTCVQRPALPGCFQLFRAGAVALDRFCHDDGDHGDFRSHPEFRPRHHDGQTAIPDRERQRNPGQVAAEIGNAFPT
jgi:hypothetical protein